MGSYNPFDSKTLSKVAAFPSKFSKKPKNRSIGIVAFALLVVSILANQGISRADSNTTFVYYIDAPLVQNSYLWTQFENSPSTHLASFNNLPNNSDCSFDNFPGVSFSNNAGGRCFTDNSTNWGGSTTLSSNPSTGGYANSTWDNTFMHGVISGTGATLNFDQPQRYFGIWWTAGSYGNQIKFYSGDQIVGATSADEVMSRLSDPNSSFTSDAGDSFARDLYYGHPASYSPIEVDDWNQISEITDISLLGSAANFSKGILDPNEPFTYIHFFTDNNVTFDRVVMSAPGNGFEFDNIVVSDEADLLSNLNSRLIPQGTVLQPVEVTFNANPMQGGTGNSFSRIENTYTILPDSCPSWPSNCFSNDSDARFIGWNTEPDGSGTQFGTTQYDDGWLTYDIENSSAIYDYSESITLYAQWNHYFNFYQDQTYTPSEPSFLNVLHGAPLVLPTPTARSGFTFSGWSYIDWDNIDYNIPYDPPLIPYPLTFVGMPGESIPLDQYQHFWSLYESWTQGNTPTTNPTVIASPSKIPVDPRVNTAVIPSLPVDTAAFSLCVAEVTDSTGTQTVQSSDLSFATSPTESATGQINIFANARITGAGSRFVRITVSDAAIQDCNPGNSITIELSPLQLNGGNTVTVPIGRQ